MHEQFVARTLELQRRLADRDVEAALLTDPDTIYYLSGYWGYLGIEFGRPTLLFVPRSGECAVITPAMEDEMSRTMTWIADVRPWSDGAAGEWRTPLRTLLERCGRGTLGIERWRTPALIGGYLNEEFGRLELTDVSPIMAEMRMIKSAEEIEIMRQAGQVAVAMAEAARSAIVEGVPEYEVALAVIAGGTRKAAELLSAGPPHQGAAARLFSPTIHNLQILQSGHDTAMVHRRSTLRRLEKGDPIYLCFCGIANFKQYKLGFDREYFVGRVSDEQARIYESAVQAQTAALEAIRPGVAAEEVHGAADAVYREAGFASAYRTGRSIGCSNLESPELKSGERTLLAPGMTFAVDGGITLPGRFGARVGDSIVVTETGFECLTPYPRELCIL